MIQFNYNNCKQSKALRVKQVDKQVVILLMLNFNINLTTLTLVCYPIPLSSNSLMKVIHLEQIS